MDRGKIVGFIVVSIIVVAVLSTISFAPSVFDLFANIAIFVALFCGLYKFVENKPSIEKRTKEIIDELNKKGKSE